MMLAMNIAATPINHHGFVHFSGSRIASVHSLSILFLSLRIWMLRASASTASPITITRNSCGYLANTLIMGLAIAIAIASLIAPSRLFYVARVYAYEKRRELEEVRELWRSLKGVEGLA